MIYAQVKNPVWSNAEHTTIDCQVDFDKLDEDFVHFTASPDDTEAYGREIFADCVAGKYGPVAEYIPPPPPPPPSAEMNKRQAEQRLAATDWVNQPDVYDPNNSLHLTNRDEFLDYRSAIRAIVVNPVSGNLDWPIEPTAVWSN